MLKSKVNTWRNTKKNTKFTHLIFGLALLIITSHTGQWLLSCRNLIMQLLQTVTKEKRRNKRGSEGIESRRDTHMNVNIPILSWHRSGSPCTSNRSDTSWSRTTWSFRWAACFSADPSSWNWNENVEVESAELL